MIGPCAKTRVKCTIVSVCGKHFVGYNDVANPQLSCPRLPGEDYEKCLLVCQQFGHAEELALEAAQGFTRGATAYLEGLDNYCKPCQKRLQQAGINVLVFGPPPK